MASRKASSPAAVKANEAREYDLLGSLIGSYANLSTAVFQTEKLRLRFGLSPELAAALALLAFGGAQQ